jgi:hypothetical protein
MATIHFEILRRIAETASGLRYHDTWFVITDTDVKIYRDQEPQEVPFDAVVIKSTAWKKPDIPPVTCAFIASGENEIDLLNVPAPPEELQGWGSATMKADAVFWSASAVEKFLTPYYASTYGSLAPEAVAQLMNIFVPPGSPELKGNMMMQVVEPAAELDTGECTTLGTPTVTVTDPIGYDQPFAVVHLPSSEYTAGTPDGGDGLPRLYTLHRSGAVKKLKVDVNVTVTA